MDSHATQRKKSSGDSDQQRSTTASSGKSDGVKPSEESIGGKTPLIGGKTPLGIDSSSGVKPASKLRLKQPDGHHGSSNQTKIQNKRANPIPNPSQNVLQANRSQNFAEKSH